MMVIFDLMFYSSSVNFFKLVCSLNNVQSSLTLRAAGWSCWHFWICWSNKFFSQNLFSSFFLNTQAQTCSFFAITFITFFPCDVAHETCAINLDASSTTVTTSLFFITTAFLTIAYKLEKYHFVLSILISFLLFLRNSCVHCYCASFRFGGL